MGYGRLLLQQLHSMRQMNRMELWVNRHDQPIVKEVVDSVDYLSTGGFFFLTAEYEANGRPDEIEVEAEVEVDRRRLKTAASTISVDMVQKLWLRFIFPWMCGSAATCFHWVQSDINRIQNSGAFDA